MKQSLLFFIFIFFLILQSCDKDDEAPAEVPAQVSVMFTPTLDGNDVVLFNHYTNADGYPFFVKDLKFYLSNIVLIAEDSTEVKLSDIELFSLRDQRNSPAYTIPFGKYVGISFNLGVPAELNSPENPDFQIGVYPDGHPLSEANGMFWDWQGGYRFFSIEGFCDTVPNTNETLPISYGLHTGLDTLYRRVPVLPYTFDVASQDVALIPLEVNLNTFFSNGNSHIDLKYENQFHGNINTLPLGIKVANNSAAAFEIFQ